MSSSARYSAVAIALHWAIALGVGFMIWLGWNMDGHEARFQLHKSIGITILLLTVARLIWRLINPPPPLPADMKPLEKTASHLVHLGFYGLLIIMPLTGWLVVSTSYDFDIATVLYGQVSWPDLPFVGFLSNETGHGIVAFIHSKLAWVMIGLVGLHVLGALKHEFSSEEGVLKRMLPGLFGKTHRPSPPPRGFFLAFGAAVGLFILIAFVPPLISGAANDSSGQTPETSVAQDISVNWQIDYDQSDIKFHGMHEGNRFDGNFSDWAADIQFNPADLENARAQVRINVASAKAGKKLYTDSLKAEEWLDPAGHRQATVDLTGFRKTGEGYTANATLTLKDTSILVPFTFQLDKLDGQTRMTGMTSVERKPLDLGQTSDPGADWVSETIGIDAVVVATRQN